MFSCTKSTRKLHCIYPACYNDNVFSLLFHKMFVQNVKQKHFSATKSIPTRDVFLYTISLKHKYIFVVNFVDTLYITRTHNFMCL